jgi:hypothetical protein
MNGAMAEPPAKTIKAPKKSKVKMMGNSQYFLRYFRNPHKSRMKSMDNSPELLLKPGRLWQNGFFYHPERSEWSQPTEITEILRFAQNDP